MLSRIQLSGLNGAEGAVGSDAVAVGSTQRGLAKRDRGVGGGEGGLL